MVWGMFVEKVFIMIKIYKVSHDKKQLSNNIKIIIKQ